MEYYNTRYNEVEKLSKIDESFQDHSQSSNKTFSIEKNGNFDVYVKKPSNFDLIKNSVIIERTIIRRNRTKIILIMIIIILIISYFTSVVTCSGFDWKGCRNE